MKPDIIIDLHDAYGMQSNDTTFLVLYDADLQTRKWKYLYSSSTLFLLSFLSLQPQKALKQNTLLSTVPYILPKSNGN